MGIALSTLSTSDRLKIAMGGFVTFTGLIVLIIVFLTAAGTVDISSVYQNQVMVAVAVILGVVDVLCGIILVFRKEKLRWLIPTKKKKADDNVENPDKTPKPQAK